jgi:Family of unknown function (DUF6518)
MMPTTIDPLPVPQRRSLPRRVWWLTALVAGALLGVLDLVGQVHTPYPLAHLFNSPAVWAAAAFGFGWWAGEAVASITGAVIVMIVGVEAYYLADVLVRGADPSNLTSPTALVWLAAGIGAGIAFGAAGWWASERSGWRAVIGRAALPTIFGAEAVYNLVRVATEPTDGRPDDLEQVVALLLLLAAISLTAVVRGAPRAMAARVVAVAAGAALVLGLVAGWVI